MATLPPIRAHLLTGALLFTQAASLLPGVERIALLGSLATAKADPKDIDLLVTVADDANLTQLAALGRKLLGHAQSRNTGADVFLASPRGAYLGRLCPWKVCQPGVRQRCDALHCGRRPYLHDDLKTITLKRDLVVNPPIVSGPR
ncbi:MAG: nucleotidyltransferase domain-containing protein [Chloroflexales bacterium]|nr:nucleotidyltransferase domain-containing protein [Chloroflexales bacterium]